jgi:rsbT co-antagonist protein RsbR
MAEPPNPTTEALMQQMGLTSANIERRLQFVGFVDEDAKAVRALSDVVVTNLDTFTAAFFDHLASFGEASGLTQNPALLDRAQQLKRAHLRAMVSGNYDAHYVEERIKLALLYSHAGLEAKLFLGAFHNLMRTIGLEVLQKAPQSATEGFARFMSLKKIAFFDLSLIVDVIVFERERVIRVQQEALRELSTPVLQIRERLLILPIIGIIDTRRARQVTESLLHAIRTHRAKVAVIDITGVPFVDSKVANHLMQTVMAARLMGALAIVTGLSAEVAQALVTLGVDLRSVRTAGDLQGGLEDAERILGYTMVREASAARPQANV